MEGKNKLKNKSVIKSTLKQFLSRLSKNKKIIKWGHPKTFSKFPAVHSELPLSLHSYAVAPERLRRLSNHLSKKASENKKSFLHIINIFGKKIKKDKYFVIIKKTKKIGYGGFEPPTPNSRS